MLGLHICRKENRWADCLDAKGLHLHATPFWRDHHNERRFMGFINTDSIPIFRMI